MKPTGEGPPRRKVDLTRLPVWLQYSLAIVVVGAVVALVLILPGRRAPVSTGRVFLAIVAFLVAALFVRLFARTRK
jgi:hypothetical protein